MTILRKAILDLFDPGVPTTDAAERHFDPSFRQRVDGAWIDRAAFVAGIEVLKEDLVRVDVSVLDELVVDERYAERHVIDLELRNGARIAREVYVFGRRGPDGRFVSIEEATIAP
ncbi:nuclear transport factor 2 family protein [Luteibacter sp. 3190]|uniref:nuclear transport factor 2 family protein n=1 Tax=Luteibacter sp. 3190 TaxID=2817736 RepID=UPI00285BBF2B|nr:nuclear transport factor 2 family protein [Luteibacter sp. 3190]MDR6936510.1 hypothetical protein [Luteibacter sp. 3190]